MTIAACHLSPEGVVLGADSATTLNGGPDGTCHLDFAQKIFEVGPEGASVGLVTWGLGQIGDESHRTIAARLGNAHAKSPFDSLGKMATYLSEDLGRAFEKAYSIEIARYRELEEKAGYTDLEEDETKEINELRGRLSGGYCLAGRTDDFGACEAQQILWGVDKTTPEIGSGSL
ncbi:MAG: hypothetical protein KF757_00125 [Phycisphaeraceae bacterium]|nr:hypothetical protein [Phycisphaeraceae bacterium]MCW5761613.1 hypothetical protein [Phycisphaeraceae bacterium]